MRPVALALAALCATAAPLYCQQARTPRFPGDTVARTRHTPPAPLAALMSAAVPGVGEYALGLDRWVPRVALEGLGWWEYRAHRRDAREFERRYRTLACQVARRGFSGVCPDTADFEYYEQMGKGNSSGRWDSDPATAGLQPETDASTFNGRVWILAQQLYSRPSDALLYYRIHAITPNFLWDWGDNTLERTVYDEVIRRGDDAFRTSSRILGLILVNHVTSAVDAYIAGRLRELSRRQLDVRSGFEPAGGGAVRWTGGVRIGVGHDGPARPSH